MLLILPLLDAPVEARQLDVLVVAVVRTALVLAGIAGAVSLRSLLRNALIGETDWLARSVRAAFAAARERWRLRTALPHRRRSSPASAALVPASAGRLKGWGAHVFPASDRWVIGPASGGVCLRLATVEPGAPAVDLTLEQIVLRQRCTVLPVGIWRQDAYITDPGRHVRLIPGDQVVLSGYAPDLDLMLQLFQPRRFMET